MKKTKLNNKVCFACEMCNNIYKDEGEAQICETWCTEHQSCNPTIAKKALNLKRYL